MATYDYLKSKNGHKIQVESAKRDGAGKNIENNYAKQNGYYAQLTAGLADNLTPYSEDSGDLQENPFISNGTGTNNNQEIVTVGDYALVQEKQGNSVVANQLMSNDRASGSSDSVVYTNNGDGTFTLNGTATGANFVMNLSTVDTKWISGHKYLVLVNGFENTNAKCMLNQHGATTQVSKVVDTSTSGLTTNSSLYPRVYIANGDEVSSIKVSIKVVDLTQWGFTADEITDITANPSHFFWYYNGSLAYNAGSLESANGVKLVSTGRNLWDEQTKITNGHLGTKNYTRVIPNSKIRVLVPTGHNITNLFSNGWKWYDKDKNQIGKTIYYFSSPTITVPSNACFFTFELETSYGTTYNHDITISIYYTPEQGGEGYDKYYPYEEPTIVDTGNEVLRSAGSVKDYKTKDGVVHRLVGSYTVPANQQLVADPIPGQITTRFYFVNTFADAASGNVIPAISSKLIKANYSEDWVGFYINGKRVYVKLNVSTVEEAQAFLSGMVINYKLAQETTEQGTPYPETLPINDYGMLYWLDENDNLVGIPQGAKIFFPVNYKGFVDDVYSRTSGDAENLVVQSELSASETARDTVDTQLKDAIGGTLRQLLASSQSLDFDNTLYVDLGTLSWSYNSSFGVFFTNVPNKKVGLNNFICSKYSIDSSAINWTTMANNKCRGSSDGDYFYIKDTTYTDADNFKAAMKGVLLAYEKA